MSEKKEPVDYMDLIARASEIERVKRNVESVLPEPAGQQVVDYMAVSDAWKEERGWMENRKCEKGNN